MQSNLSAISNHAAQLSKLLLLITPNLAWIN